MTEHTDDLDDDVTLEPSDHPDVTAANGALVFIMETALRDLNAHAAEEPQHEIGGILVGSVTDGDRPVVFVEASIRGKSMTHTRGSVTFTHETWNSINTIKDEKYPDLKIVGWYHSHPGFGLFLSGHDLFIHRNFFSAPWQVAVVSDPLAKSWGCFTWRGQELEQDSSVHTVAVRWRPEEDATAAAPAPSQSPPVVIRTAPAPVPVRGLSWALGVLALLLTVLLSVALQNYRELNALRSEVTALARQSNDIAHQLTAVRDRMLESQPQPTSSEETSPPGGPTNPPSPGPIGPITGSSTPEAPAGATDSGRSAP
jgi:proteasome lid subunit RPN8/RPN11